MTINGPLDITLNRRPSAGHRTPPEPRCARCGTVVLPAAPRVVLDTTEAMVHGGTDWHPGCWAAEQSEDRRSA